MRLREGVGSDDKWCLGEESGRKRRLREVLRPREAIPGGGGWRLWGRDLTVMESGLQKKSKAGRKKEGEMELRPLDENFERQ